MSTQLLETTIRDFGGGWDVSDSDKSLSAKYQVISENVLRRTDGSFEVRQGTMLFADLRKGIETPVTQTVTLETVAASGFVKVTHVAHGYTTGNHVNITAVSAGVGGFTADQLLGVHSIIVIDVDNYSFYIRGEATAQVVSGVTLTGVHDTHLMSGRDIFGRYYQDHLIIFDDTGEIFAVGIDGTPTVIWNFNIANALTLQPWGPCKRVSAEIVRGKLIAVNGALNDKPLEIDGTSVNYLVDASSLSNAAIPRADFVISSDRYVLLISTEYGATKVEISAKNTVATFSRETDPSDAVEIDLGMLTQSVESTILGANVIRSKVFIGFHDRSQLGTLGVYTGTDPNLFHEPDFKDNVAQLGTYSHHSIVSLGNDLLCVGLNGINSLAVSQSSGEFTPTTVSDLIHPVLLRHLTRLTEDDRRFKTFAVWDPNLRNYMLFMPKYSAVTDTLPQDAVIASSTLQPHSLMYLQYPSHTMDVGDEIDISGVTDDPASHLFGSMVNGRRRVRAVYDDDTLIIETDAYPTGENVVYGGLSITVTPVNDETPCYVYEYNPRLKIRRWTRYRGWNYNWGAISQLNKLYFGKDGRVYRMGSAVDKYYADKLNDYTIDAWSNNTAYNIGDRVPDTENKIVYLCHTAHTSPATGTFKDYRNANGAVWERFRGIPIKWEVETGWTDFKERKTNKQIELVSFDTKGTAEFEFSVYTHGILTDFESFLPIPRRTTIFIGQDAPGFGAGPQPFGGGRNTRQEWLRGMPVEGKTFRLRFAGETTDALQVNAATLYYHKSRTLT